MALNSYQDLMVWQKSRQLVKDIYLLCGDLPKDELYGLSNQMKRASVSIPSNIAEGYRRNNRKEYVQFLGVALGSTAELETQIILAHDIFQVNVTEELKTAGEIHRMLLSMRRKLQP